MTGNVSAWTLITLVFAGTMLALLITNVTFTQNLINSLTKVWKWAVNSMMGGNG